MKKKLPLLLVIAFSIAFTTFFYGKILVHPNKYMFSNSGDGIKNYFTYAYHIKFDTSYTEFMGMNYPYGENFLYTDCHPILANLFRFLSAPNGFFTNHSIGILNFLMIFSIFLTFILCYLILIKFIDNKWFAAFFSIGMTMLAPQIFRLGGHLALSYSAAIPLSWLLLITAIQRCTQIKWVILLFINGLFWLFIHAYLGVIVLFFSILIILFFLFVKQKNTNELKHRLKIIIALILPVIIFYLVTLITDHHLDRTKNPFGFLFYSAELDDVFVPHHPPLRPILDHLTHGVIRLKWEAWSYVGLSSALIYLSLLILSIISVFKKNTRNYLTKFFNNKELNISLVSATIVLLFAMAIPFKQFPVLLDVFSFVKPFRAVGRFTWPFYFVTMVFSVSVLYQLTFNTVSKTKKVFWLTVSLCAGLFNIAEGLPYHIEVARNISANKNLFSTEMLSPSEQQILDHIDASNYQAIIALPFYYQGSESFGRPKYDQTERTSIVISYYTGLPVVNADLTRTAIPESKKIVQLVSPDFYPKLIQPDLTDNRPFLVITTTDQITIYEKDLLAKCHLIYRNENTSLFSLKKEDIFQNSALVIYTKYLGQKPFLYQKDGFELSNGSSFFYYNGFEDRKSEYPFRGQGGYSSVKKGTNLLAEFGPDTFQTGIKYHISIWMYNGHNDALNDWFRFIIDEYDEATNNWLSTTFFPDASETIFGNWSLVEGTFTVNNSKNKIVIVTKGKKEARPPFYADDLMITKEGTDVYRFNENAHELFYNNHLVKLNDSILFQ